MARRSGNHLRFFNQTNDTVNGSDASDFIDTDGGNDTINAGGGRDHVFGGDGNDQINGGDGADMLFGEAGDDDIKGENGNDQIRSGSGDDTVDGGEGADKVFAGKGDDTLIHALEGSTGPRPDQYDGGKGFDTLQINLTADQWGDPEVQAELTTYITALQSGDLNNGFNLLSSINLKLRGIEEIEIFVDGILIDPFGNSSVTAVDDDFSTGENTVLSDSVALNDSAPVGAIFSLISNVTEGTLLLDTNGEFSFDTDGDFDHLALGEEATESFSYQITAGRETDTATVTLCI